VHFSALSPPIQLTNLHKAPNGCAIDQANPAGGKLAEQSGSSRPRLRGKQWTTISERVGERAGNTYFPAGDPMTTRQYARLV